MNQINFSKNDFNNYSFVMLVLVILLNCNFKFFTQLYITAGMLFDYPIYQTMKLTMIGKLF